MVTTLKSIGFDVGPKTHGEFVELAELNRLSQGTSDQEIRCFIEYLFTTIQDLATKKDACDCDKAQYIGCIEPAPGQLWIKTDVFQLCPVCEASQERIDRLSSVLEEAKNLRLALSEEDLDSFQLDQAPAEFSGVATDTGKRLLRPFTPEQVERISKSKNPVHVANSIINKQHKHFSKRAAYEGTSVTVREQIKRAKKLAKLKKRKEVSLKKSQRREPRCFPEPNAYRMDLSNKRVNAGAESNTVSCDTGHHEFKSHPNMSCTLDLYLEAIRRYFPHVQMFGSVADKHLRSIFGISHITELSEVLVEGTVEDNDIKLRLFIDAITQTNKNMGKFAMGTGLLTALKVFVYQPEEEDTELRDDFAVPIFEFLKQHTGGFLDRYLMPISIFCMQVYRARDWKDIALAAGALASGLGFKLSDVWHLTSKAAEKVKELFMNIKFRRIQARAESNLTDSLASAKSILDYIMSSQLVEAMRSIFFSVISMQIFSAERSEKFISILGTPPKMTISQAALSLIDNLILFMRVGDNLLAGQSLLSALMDTDPIVSLIDQAKVLGKFADRLYDGLPVPNKMHRAEFLRKSGDLIEAMNSMLEGMPKKAPKAKWLRGVRDELLQLDVVARGVIKTQRTTPVGIVLCGDPGIGKSKIRTFIFSTHSKVMGRDFEEGYVFSKNPDTEYCDGYDPVSNPYIHFSEVANTHAQLVARIGDATLSQYNAIVDSNPYLMNMSSVEDKGKIYARPELCLIETNNPGLNLKVLYNNPAATARRNLYIHPVVKPEFRVAGSNALDSLASFASDTNLLDRYYFDAYTEVPIDAQESRQEFLCRATERADIYQLKAVLEKYFVQHVEREEKASAKLSAAIGEILCDAEEVVDVKAESAVVSGDQEEGSLYYARSFVQEMMKHYRKTSNLGQSILSSGEILASFIVTLVLYITIFLSNSGPPPASLMFVMLLPLMYLSPYYGLLVVLYLWWKMAYNRRYVINCSLIWKKSGIMSLPGKFQHFLTRNGFASNKYNRASFWYFMNSSRADPLIATLSFMMICITGMKVGNLVDERLHKRFVMDQQVAAVSERVQALEKRNNVNDDGNIGTDIDDLNERLDRIDALSGAPTSGVVCEGYTVFYNSSTINEQLQDMEEKSNCAYALKRIPIKGVNTWNIMQESSAPPMYTGSSDDFLRAISRNIYFVKVEIGNTVSRTHIFGIKDNYAVINSHVLTNGYNGLIRVYMHDDDENITKDTLLSEFNCHHLECDITLIRLTNMRFRNVLQHIGGYSNEIQVEGFIRGRRCLASYHNHFSTPLRINATHSSTDVTNYWEYDYTDHFEGMCGVPLVVAKGKGYVVTGIHAAGRTDSSSSYAVCLQKEVIACGIEVMNSSSVIVPQCSVSEISFDVSEPISKSLFRYEYLPGIEYIGKLPGNVLMNDKSKLIPFPNRDELQDLICNALDFVPKTLWSKPDMSPGFKNGEWFSPYNVNVNKMNIRKVAVDSTLIEIVVREKISHYVGGLIDRGVVNISPLTIQEAVNGSLDDAFLRRVNTSTSVGFGHSGKKREYLDEVYNDGTLVIREPNDSIKLEIANILGAYLRDESLGVVYSACLKDEARDYEKVKKHDTRLFYMSPLAHLIVSRMYLYPIFTRMVEFNDLFHCAVGIDTHSNASWLASRLGETNMEGDYSKFDITVPVGIREANNSVLYGIAKHLGYNECALTILKGILSDNLHPYVELKKDLFLATGVKPSGMYGTAEDNCGTNDIIIHYLFYQIMGPEYIGKYYELVRPTTLGDDVMIDVSPSIIDRFNNVSFAAACDAYLGMKYTPAAKNDALRPFLAKDEVSFLKRKFRFRDDIGQWVAPLDPDSFIKMTSYIMPSPVLPLPQQVYQTLRSLCDEIYFHLSERDYSAFVRQISILFENCLPTDRVPFLSFYELTDRIFGRSSTTSQIAHCEDKASAFQ